MSSNQPGRGSDQFPLRFPDGMRERIKEAAKLSGRSMNAEIIARLEASFQQPPPGGLFGLGAETPDVSELIKELKDLRVRLDLIKALEGNGE